MSEFEVFYVASICFMHLRLRMRFVCMRDPVHTGTIATSKKKNVK